MTYHAQGFIPKLQRPKLPKLKTVLRGSIPRVPGMAGFAGLGATDLALDSAAPITAQRNRLGQEWHPTGYYTPKDVVNVVSQLQKIYVAVRAPYVDFLSRWQSMPILKIWTDRARAQLGKIDATNASASTRYLAAATTGASHGVKYIDAPGLRAMALNYLTVMSWGVTEFNAIEADLATRGASLIDKLWNGVKWFAKTTGLATVANAAGDALMAITGVAAEVAKSVGSALMKIPDTIGTLLTVAKWGAIAFVGVFLYRELGLDRGSRSGPRAGSGARRTARSAAG